MTTKNYLLLKNSLNLELSVVLQKINLIHAGKSSKIGIENPEHEEAINIFKVKELEKALKKLDTIYQEKKNFTTAVSELHKHLFPPIIISGEI
ncbi:TPA: hypothetical protein DEP21_00885 [Patescibacteria group bacterium]|nr:hypothetical protein [Candidatus Gracilibacteria bacterium]